MIIEPDFPDHWKTQLLISLTGEASAPLLVVRLWAFCQQRKQWQFHDLTDNALAAICRWTRPAAELRRVLLEAGFLDELAGENGKTVLEVHDFAAVNAKLVTNWANGRHGGRRSTPTATQPEPKANPQAGDRLDRVEGLDRSEGDKPQTPRGGKRGKKPKTGATPEDIGGSLGDRMLRVNTLLSRLDSTAWSTDEIEAFAAAGLDRASDEAFAEQLAPLASYYGADIPREKDYRRRDVLRLLRNWAGEIDRARIWQRENGGGQAELKHL